MRRVDELGPGDTITGTWAATWPHPRTVATIVPAPEHSTTDLAWHITFTDGGPDKVLYSACTLHTT